MARKPRVDPDGTWHHVFNRGIARRVVFVVEADYRYFKACVAKAVRRREIELHAHALLPNHFHLLIRSRGKLSLAMKRIESSYVRRFNRRHRRDGSLFRGRFGSRIVTSNVDRGLMVRYIDGNPVRARLAAAPEDYRHCSAYDLLIRRMPPWLSSEWIAQRIGTSPRNRRTWRRAYTETFPLTTLYMDEVIERRMRQRHPRLHANDLPLMNASKTLRDWVDASAMHADGTLVPHAISSPADIRDVILEARIREPDWTIMTNSRAADGWLTVQVALLRELVGLAYIEIAAWVGCSQSRARRSFERHRDAMSQEGYLRRLEAAAIRAMDKLRKK